MSVYHTIRPLLFSLPPETAHRATLWAIKNRLVPCLPVPDDPVLHTKLWGRRFLRPVGIAAGFDKNAECLDGLFALGFGFAEVGTITPQPQAGNPRPRVFRHPPSASLINRMGFPGSGVASALHHLKKFRARTGRAAGPVGVNIGMNKDQTDPLRDYVVCLNELARLADYIVVNVSSPNTPGLRDLQQEDRLKELLKRLQDERGTMGLKNPPPLLVKLSPDMDDTHMENLSRLLLDIGIDGVILTNTTLTRPDTLPAPYASQKGGLSGAPLTTRSRQVIHRFYAATGGRIPIIGAGGIGSAEDAYRAVRAGASLVQIYTGLVYEGPDLIRKICVSLGDMLRADGFLSLSAAVGADHAKQ